VRGYLLDTHVWLWHLLADDRLSRRARKLIDDSLADCWLSPISIWETRMLIERGRFHVEGDFRDWIERAYVSLPLRAAPLVDEVAMACFETDLPHRDPADRFLAATATVYDLTLVTADRRLLGSPSLATVSASA
jgi:PIN domain nuclease of toxin-antitoxin system